MTNSSNVRLLALPTEIRLRIYELAYGAQYVNKKLVWPNGYMFHIYSGAKTSGTPWTLLRSCRHLHAEINEMLPSIPQITFHFHQLSEADVRLWLSRMSCHQISQIRNLTISGVGKCQQPKNSRLVHNVYYDPVPRGDCERSLIVHLPDDILSADKDRFHRVLSRIDGGSGVYDARFYKGFFLLRVKGDVVKIAKPDGHPRGQCNSVVEQQKALGDFITLEGELCVNREAVVRLVKAVMTDECPGGPGTGRRLPANGAV